MFKCSCCWMKCDEGSDAWKQFEDISHIHVFLQNLGQHVPRKINMEFAKVGRKRIFWAKMAFSRWKNLEQPSHFVHLIGTDITFCIVLGELELESHSITLKTGLSNTILPNGLISGIRWLVNHEILWPPLASCPVFCLQRLNSRRMKMEEGLTNVDLLRPKKLRTVLCTDHPRWCERLFDQILKLPVVPIKFGID